jgi:hypothetical protein
LVEIDAGCAESSQFRGQLAAIPAFNRARRELAQNAYPTHYTRFLHQPSVDDETCRKRLGLFEELVCDKGKTEPAAMRAASLEAILKTACRAPHGPEFGYTLFFEQEISRDLMHELVRRVAIQMTGAKTLEAWTTKLFTWDSKFELHLPPALVENVEFLSLLRANDEATQLARAIVLQDRSMMPSLDNAKEDRQERDKAAQEHQLKASAESKALNYSTGLSFAIGRFALQILPVSPLAGDRVASLMLELESVSPRALNSALRDSRLLDLVCNEDSRQVWFSSFFSAVADELKLHGIASKPGCTTGAFVAGISDHFIATATQYMERLDHSGSYRWTLEDLE